jgi:hypothetical protein
MPFLARTGENLACFLSEGTSFYYFLKLVLLCRQEQNMFHSVENFGISGRSNRKQTRKPANPQISCIIFSLPMMSIQEIFAVTTSASALAAHD